MRELQEFLSSRGCEVGGVDGQWGRKTSAGAEAFAKSAGIPIERPITLTLIAELAASDARCPGLLSRFVPQSVVNAAERLSSQGKEGFCPISSQEISRLLGLRPYDRVEGLTSNMKNAFTLPAFVSLDTMAPLLSVAATSAYVNSDAWLKTALVGKLAEWANAGAYLRTRNCKTSTCPPDWRTEEGNEEAPAKDAHDTKERLYSMARAYYLLLADHDAERLKAEHSSIRSWFGRFFDRLTDGGANAPIYFGYGLGWQWPNALHDLLNANEGRFRARLENMLKGLDRALLDDGAIRDRTVRGSRAIHYHFTSLNELMVSLEVLQANALEAYPRFESRLHRAMTILLDAFDDPMAIYPWAQANFEAAGDWRDQSFVRADIGGAAAGVSALYIYVSRFPDHENSRRILQILKNEALHNTKDLQFGIALPCLYRAALSDMGLWEPPLPPPPPPGIEFSSLRLEFDEEREDRVFFNIFASGTLVDGKRLRPPRVQLMAQFDGKVDDLHALSAFAFGVESSALIDMESRLADYSDCSDMSFDKIDGTQFWLQFYMGNGAELNSCLLGHMGPNDQLFWRAMLGNLQLVLDTARESADSAYVDRLQGYYDVVSGAM